MSFSNLVKSKMTTRQNALNAVGIHNLRVVPRFRAVEKEVVVDPVVTTNQNRPQRKCGNNQESIESDQALLAKRPRDGETSIGERRPTNPTSNVTKS